MTTTTFKERRADGCGYRDADEGAGLRWRVGSGSASGGVVERR